MSESETPEQEPDPQPEPDPRPSPDPQPETEPDAESGSAPPTRSFRDRWSARRAALVGWVGGAALIAGVTLPAAWIARRPIATQAPAPIVLASATTESAPSAPEIADAGVEAPPPRPHVWRIADDTSDSRAAVLTGTVGKKGMLAAMLAAGLTDKESHRIIKAYARVKNLDRAAPKDTFFAERRSDADSGTPQLFAFELASSPFDVWQAKVDEQGELVAAKLDLEPDKVRVAVGFVLGDDLKSTLKQAGLHDDIVSLIDDALDGHAELSDLRAGGKLRLVATEDRLDGEFVRYGALDAVEWTGAGRSAVRVYWFPKGWTEPARKEDGSAGSSEARVRTHAESGSRGGFYDGKGHQPYHGGWRSPIPLARISSRYNPNRMHPVLHVVMPHNGVDFAAPSGTPIYAAASGVVRSAGDGGPCGNMVQIDHPNGLTSAYCHMSRIANIHAGEHVDTRQLIGYVGQTGRATGPHLHFAVKRGDIFMDPLTLKLDGVRVLPSKDKDEFDELRMKDDEALDAIAMPETLPDAIDAGDPDAAPEFYE